MDRDKAIRRIVTGMKGKEREATILQLCKSPHLLPLLLDRLRNGETMKPRKGRVESAGRTISLNIRVTPEEYIKIRDTSKKAGMSMSQLTRNRLLVWED